MCVGVRGAATAVEPRYDIDWVAKAEDGVTPVGVRRRTALAARPIPVSTMPPHHTTTAPSPQQERATMYLL